MQGDAREDWRPILQKHFLLKHLAPEELDKLMAFVQVRRAATGETLFEKGDPGDALWAILDGAVKISAFSDDGREITLNVLSTGDLFGEIALIDGKARTANATAMQPSRFLLIHRRDFMPFLASHPDLSTRLLVILCERIRWVSDLYEDALFLNLPARLAKKLLQLAEDHGEEAANGDITIKLKLSQSELGNLLGTSRESVNKQLRAWQESGLVRSEKGRITLTDPETLEVMTGAV